MFGSEVLDVALGLVLVFLLMSLVLTSVQEGIEAWLRSRAGDLTRAIYELLQRDNKLIRDLYDHPLIFALHRSGVGSGASLTALAASGRNPLSKRRREARAARKMLPSYVPRETFAAALIDMFQTGSVTDPNLLKSLDALNRLAGGNLARVRAEIEGWYDGAMDRASGWYKRRTQKILFGLGLAAALLLNVNAVVIARYLATDQDARVYAARYAEQILSSGVPDTDDIKALQRNLQDTVGLPIGWSGGSLGEISRLFPAEDEDEPLLGVLAAIVLAIGYLIPAFAAMLGAPFWFDVLNRIMVIRSTVKPKEKSPDEPSEDGGGGKPGSAATKEKTTEGAGVGVDGAALQRPVNAVGGGAPAGVVSAGAEDGPDLDGCLEDYDVPQEEATDDVDLPPAEGGVKDTDDQGEQTLP